MNEHRLIAVYREELLSQLPAHLADEVSDGLTDAHEKYLSHGLSPDQAARAAIAEFGSARVVADAFRRACPTWRAARALIATAPIVGGSWAAALIAGRAWDWPVPAAGRVLVGAVLAASVLLLVIAAVSRRYEALRRAGLAGCVGVVLLDVSAITTAALLAPSLRWLLIAAAGASAIRLAYVASRMPSLVSRPTV